MKFFQQSKASIFLSLGYVVVAIGLLLYSYTQVDLNLTLSRSSVAQTIQKAFQYIGYYNRPLSVILYLGIVASLYLLYIRAIYLAKKGLLSVAAIWRIIIAVTIMLVGSYPAAFSYDFFNYMFTAKTVLVYHKNPYTVIPLQFAGIDPWTNFMRWTHLSSAYTPLWILMTLVPYMLGLGYFLIILFGIKALVAGFYLLACLYLARIVERENKQAAAVSLAIFALNPLVLIESLISGHNDIVMVAFVLVAFWYTTQRETLIAWWYLALSVAAKFMTIFLIPIFFLKKNKVLMLLAMLGGLTLVIFRRGEMLPWYWVWIVPFIALIPDNEELVVASTVFSVGLLMRYAIYIYAGTYDPWVISLSLWLPYICLSIGCLAAIFMRVKKGHISPHH